MMNASTEKIPPDGNTCAPVFDSHAAHHGAIPSLLYSTRYLRLPSHPPSPLARLLGNPDVPILHRIQFPLSTSALSSDQAYATPSLQLAQRLCHRYDNLYSWDIIRLHIIPGYPKGG